VKESWIRVAVLPTSGALRESVSAALFSAGAVGVHEDGDWLVTHVERPHEARRLEAAARAADPSSVIETSDVPAVDWSVAWRERAAAHIVGRLTVAPPWLAAGLDPATTVFIEPAMAFGTGDHATTRGVIRLMQDVVRAGDTVADLGAGSAVLAIAAAKLGAARVAAIEMDGDAITNAEENVARNAAADRVKVIEGDAMVLLPLVGPVRVVLANIVSSVLVQLLPVIAGSLADDGIAILSGILEEERERMVWMLSLKGWRILAEDREEGWWSVAITRT
jgi:ribosomal protein L11 methyltransferase